MILIDSFKSYASVAAMARTWASPVNAAGMTLLDPGLQIDGTTLTSNNYLLPYGVSRLHVAFNFTVKVRHASDAANVSFFHSDWNGLTNAQNQVALGLTVARKLLIFSGSNISGQGGTTLATGTTVLAIDTEYHIEFDVIYHPSAGAYDLRINGVSELAATGVNTDPRSSARVSAVQFIAGSSAGVGNVWQFRDVVIDDCLSPAGSVFYYPKTKVTYGVPASDNTVAWVPTTGASNAALVAAPNANPTTQYVKTSTTPTADLYNMGTLTKPPATVGYVQVRSTQLSSGSGEKALQLRVKSGSDFHDAQNARMITTSLVDWRTGWLTQPNGSAWTSATLRALKLGMQSIPYLRGWDFRSTSNLVTDPAHCTYGIATDLYPTTRASSTFGWDTAPSTFVNRTTGADVRTAGVAAQLNNGTQRNFRVDLPAAGWYQVRVQIGDRGFAHAPAYAEIYDNATLKATIVNSTTGTAIAEWFDAGQDLGTRAMPATATPPEAQISDSYARWINFSSTTFKLRIGNPTSSGSVHSCVATLEIMGLHAGSGGTADPEARVSQLALEALIRENLLPPVVDAGSDQAITLPATATMTGSATDPEGGTLTYAWTQFSGPGVAVFTDATDPHTVVTFPVQGNYVLRLTADDGDFSAHDDMTVVVSPNLDVAMSTLSNYIERWFSTHSTMPRNQAKKLLISTALAAMPITLAGDPPLTLPAPRNAVLLAYLKQLYG